MMSKRSRIPVGAAGVAGQETTLENPPAATSTPNPPESNSNQNSDAPLTTQIIGVPERRPTARVIHKQPKYKYSTLMEVNQMYPIEPGSPKKVHVYGLITSTSDDFTELTIMDETTDNFTLYVNLYYDANAKKRITNTDRRYSKVVMKKINTNTGDIVRIHRMVLNRDYTKRSYKVADLVVFRSFLSSGFVPQHFSSNPSFSYNDRKRVEELTEFAVSRLLRAQFQPIRTSTSKSLITDTAFQVMATLKLEKRTIIACWNGKPFDNFPCNQAISLGDIAYALDDCRHKHLYTDEFLKRLYADGKIIFITVYGNHRVVADMLKPTETVVFYNLIIKPDDFFFGKFSFLMYDSNKFGRCIRICEWNSVVARRIREQIENYYFLDGDIPDYENYNFDKSQSQIMSPSAIFDSADEEDLVELTNDVLLTGSLAAEKPNAKLKKTPIISPKRAKIRKDTRKSLSVSFNDTLDESTLCEVEMPIGCGHIELNLVGQETIFRNFFAKNAENRGTDGTPLLVRSFADMERKLRTDGCTEQMFQVKASFNGYNLNNTSHFASMDSLRTYGCSVQCTECQFWMNFDKFLAATDKYKLSGEALVPMEDDGSQAQSRPGTSTAVHDTNHLDRLVCPQCAQCSCILALDFRLFLQDYDRQMLVGRLTGQQANYLLSTSTSDLCSANSTVRGKVMALFKYMAHITNDIHSTCSKKILWTMKPKEVVPKKEYEYEILDWTVGTSIGVGCRL